MEKLNTKNNVTRMFLMVFSDSQGLLDDFLSLTGSVFDFLWCLNLGKVIQSQGTIKCQDYLLTMLFKKSPWGRGRWKVWTGSTRLSLAFASSGWVNSRRLIADLRNLSLGTHGYGARRTQGDTCHAATAPVASTIPGTSLINKPLPWLVERIIVQAYFTWWSTKIEIQFSW